MPEVRWLIDIRKRASGFLLFALAFCSVATAGQPPRLAPVRVDHHVHLNSPAIQAFLPQFCASVSRFGECDPALTAPYSPRDLIAAMDAAAIRCASVLSNGYLAESPLMDPQGTDAANLMREANDWTVGLAVRYPERISAFIAVNPIRATALPEIARWQGNPAVTGVKLHLTASGVDLRRDNDLTALAAVFRAAADARLAIVIHLRTQTTDYGAADVRRFLKAVLPAAGNAPVQIAHAGGWGGIDAATLSALGAFADAVEASPQRFRHVWFDLAGLRTENASDTTRQALVALIRRIGIAHFLPGSDWPYNGDDLVDYYTRVSRHLPLTKKEWAVVRSNVAPYANEQCMLR